MGTNYYLYRKTTFDPDRPIPAALGCTHGHEGEPQELDNGWVWDDTYYPDLDSLNAVFYQKIHIGKSSAGWRFLLCIYPAENPLFAENPRRREYYLNDPIQGLDDWVALFRMPGNIIKNEYGETITPERMWSLIANKTGRVEADEDGWTKPELGHTERYRVINGLCVHDESRIPHGSPQCIQIMPDDCTYDLILSGNDTESGVIFC